MNDETVRNELKNVKGGADFLPAAMLNRNRIIGILKKHFERSGFLPLETTMLCRYDLLASKYAGGAEILKEVYRLNDQGGRELGLRYDLTVPFCKVIAMNKNELNLPFKRYEIGKVFRDGPVKTGRMREFYQCDIDAVGIAGQEIEAEFFLMALEACAEIGLDVYIAYNNRKFLTGLITACGFPIEMSSEIILAVDKLEKIDAAEIKKEIMQAAEARKFKCGAKQLDGLFGALKSDMAELTEKYSANELVKEGLSELNALGGILKALGLESRCRFVPSLARGLDIYTGAVWEVFDSSGEFTSSLGGGGRYDKIITSFMDDGNVYPAVGMSFGLEPISAVLSAKKNVTTQIIDLFLVPMGTHTECLKLAKELRGRGVSVLVDYSKQKVKKSMAYADKEKIPFAAVVGSQEIENNIIKLKNMAAAADSAENKEFQFDFNAYDKIAEFLKGKN